MDDLAWPIPAVPEGCIPLPVAGACLQPLAVRDAVGGPVLHFLRPGNPLRPDALTGSGDAGALRVGEVYFSEVAAGAVKGWKRHVRQTQFFAVPFGRLRLALYDARPASPTCGAGCRVILGRPGDYALLRVPVGVWYAFGSLDGAPALLCNGADIPHDPEEGRRLPLDTPEIPYAWEERGEADGRPGAATVNEAFPL